MVLVVHVDMVTVGGATRSYPVTNIVLSLFFQEAARIQRAMKDEEFRELLTEYAQEISSPENRAVILLRILVSN